MSYEVSGVLKRTMKGMFVLRDPNRSFRRGPKDSIVPMKVVRQCGLCEGASVTGTSEKGKRGGQILKSVDSVCGMSVEDFKRRTPFGRLVAITPDERFRLGDSGDSSMRIIDLVAPIGKGTRGLIVSPPKAGKTVLLQKMANAITAGSLGTRVIVLLIDERPEEVTMFRRGVEGAEVFSSTIDFSSSEHVELAELVLANVQVDLECGKDVVVLVDSLTRMGRSFNQNGYGSQRRTMSGGMGAGALEIPRKFFGLARNIENGGSVTIIASCLIDTGSRMDQLIFEEFKGTGNSEIVLDRQLAQARIFPAIDLGASGTRKEELLYSEDDIRKIGMMRKVLSSYHRKEVIESLHKLMNKYPSNEELLDGLTANV